MVMVCAETGQLYYLPFMFVSESQITIIKDRKHLASWFQSRTEDAQVTVFLAHSITYSHQPKIIADWAFRSFPQSFETNAGIVP
jgi:hypothetical protein